MKLSPNDKKDLRNNHKESALKVERKASHRTYPIWERDTINICLRNQDIYAAQKAALKQEFTLADFMHFLSLLKFSIAVAE
jgi:hypothetical protein